MKKTEIISKENTNYKNWTKLLQKKYRDSQGLFIIEGPVLLKDAVRSNGELLELVASADEENPEEIAKELNYRGEPYILSPQLFKNLSQTENGRSILGIFRKPNEHLLSKEKEGNILVLDRIQDPGNMGTLIRTAEGAGFTEIVTIKGTVDPFSPKVVRSAAGSLLRMPIVQLEDAKETIDYLKDKGKEILVTLMDGDEIYWNRNLKNPIALVIGNEGQGVGEDFIKLADIKVRIPMTENIESLNAAMAAGIIMYEVMRQQSN